MKIQKGIPRDVLAAAHRLREDMYWGSTEDRHRDLCEDALTLAEWVAFLHATGTQTEKVA